MAGTLELVIKRNGSMIPGEWESYGLPVLREATAAEAIVIAEGIWGVSELEPVDEPSGTVIAQWTCKARSGEAATLSYWPESEVRTVAVPVSAGDQI